MHKQVYTYIYGSVKPESQLSPILNYPGLGQGLQPPLQTPVMPGTGRQLPRTYCLPPFLCAPPLNRPLRIDFRGPFGQKTGSMPFYCGSPDLGQIAPNRAFFLVSSD